MFEVIDNMMQQFPNDFEHVVRLAELYFVEKRWSELTGFVDDKVQKPVFYNDPRMEHFLWLGVAGEMNLKQWAKAKKKMRTLGELGVRSPDKLALAYLRLYLQTNKMELA